MKRIFVSDCEGPITRNDNAFELTANFVPEGDRIFNIINQYDYVHARLSKGNNYAVGNTSKLVLPFLRACNATNQSVGEFSAANLVLMKGSKENLGYTREISEAFIVSTSYEHNMRALCRAIDFPLQNTYSTRVNLDLCELSEKEKTKLKSLAWEIGGMPPLTIPPNAQSIRDLTNRDQETIKRLDHIFWKDVTGTNCKRFFSDLSINGEREKSNAIYDIANSLSSQLQDVMYVGDDATDVQAIKYVRNGGGLTVAINGDREAVKNAEVAVLSEDSITIAVLADMFLRFGKAEALNVAGNFDKDALWRSTAEPVLLDRLFEVPKDSWPKVHIISEWNMESIINQSMEFRKTVKGEPVGKKTQPFDTYN